MADLDKLIHALARDSLFERVLRTIIIPNPAAGADIAFPVPGGVVWRPITLTATLTTSAAVANRDASLSLTDGNRSLGRFNPGLVQAASLGVIYTFANGWDFASGTAALGSVSCSLPDWALPAGYVIGTSTALIDVADQWSGCTLFVEEVLDQPQGVHEMVTANRERFLLETSYASEATQ